MKKTAPPKSSEKFLRRHLSFAGDECLHWPFSTVPAGYGLATIGGVQKRASRWMCILAHGEPPFSEAEAAHYCGNPICINPKHLRWATKKENAADRKIHGTNTYGERSGRTRLTAEDVRAIRSAPPLNLQALAARYGVSKGCIGKIRSGERWPHIKFDSHDMLT